MQLITFYPLLVSQADEMLVVDSVITDNTFSICKSSNPKVFTTDDWPSFEAQKNRAMDVSKSKWIYSPDADKTITPNLQKFSNHKVHEQLEKKEMCGTPNEPSIHFSFSDFETVLNKVTLYSSQAADKMFNAEKRLSHKSSHSWPLEIFSNVFYISGVFRLQSRAKAVNFKCRGRISWVH